MKQDWEIYRDTGILGAYRPEQVILRRSEDGGVETLFRDSTAKWERKLLFHAPLFSSPFL